MQSNRECLGMERKKKSVGGAFLLARPFFGAHEIFQIFVASHDYNSHIM